MMSDQIKNTLIGLFIAIACALIIGIILFIDPKVGDGKQVVLSRFTNINGISVGTRVLFAGKPVGEVVAIQTIPHARKEVSRPVEEVYFYQLILHIDSSIKIYNTDEVSLQTSGLLGEKSIAVIPKAPPKGVKPKLVTEKTPIYADSLDPLENAFHELSMVTSKIEETLDKTSEWIESYGNTLGGTIESFGNLAKEGSKAIQTFNTLNLPKSLSDGVKQFSRVMEKAEASLSVMQQGHFFENASLTMDKIGSITSSLVTIIENIKEGKGTIGHLLTSDSLYLKTDAILSKVNTLMNDLNHYGLLFNANKEWQRGRLQRAALLKFLKTPQDLTRYFTKECDLIQTALARLQMAVKQVEEEGGNIENDKPFQKDLLTLSREVESLLNTLKLYEESLIK